MNMDKVIKVYMNAVHLVFLDPKSRPGGRHMGSVVLSCACSEWTVESPESLVMKSIVWDSSIEVKSVMSQVSCARQRGVT
jgi:hypothetical protein